ncbi:MAG TPA: glycosyltransferase [Mycobacteriales bacterium]|nr:glycosyltransferase [Mycobacteriales bacterium]
MTRVDVLIPTCDRPAALAVTLTGLAGQTFRDIRIVVADQTERADVFAVPEVAAVLRVLRHQRLEVETHRHLPRRGVGENRQFLLDRARAAYAWCLDDDVLCEPDLLARLVRHLDAQRCGFVGCPVTGLTHLDDVRPHQQHLELWTGPVRPEAIGPDAPEVDRHHLHSAANMVHVAQRLGLGNGREALYKVAWIGGCVLYDTAKLRAVGGFEFWRELPREHCGEDVLAQWRVMARFGGAGLLPSGAHHLQLPTTLPNRRADAPRLLPVDEARARGLPA